MSGGGGAEMPRLLPISEVIQHHRLVLRLTLTVYISSPTCVAIDQIRSCDLTPASPDDGLAAPSEANSFCGFSDEESGLPFTTAVSPSNFRAHCPVVWRC